ncbi:hypothetical protein [Nonomuraea dietziae]|uniref:hypothetical protein n=1 Tax=Nonomuraea dietziae TaxID=65515 RepID=UPI0033E5C0B6
MQALDLALAVRLAGRQPQHLDAQRGQRLPHRGGGELQPAVDAHQGRDRAEGATLGVADQRHPQRGQHRAGVRRQRERPPEQGAGTIVDDRGQPRAHCRAARRQHQDRQLLVVGLPDLVAMRGRAHQVDAGLAPGLLARAPAGPLGGRQRPVKARCSVRSVTGSAPAQP